MIPINPENIKPKCKVCGGKGTIHKGGGSFDGRMMVGGYLENCWRCKGTGLWVPAPVIAELDKTPLNKALAAFLGGL